MITIYEQADLTAYNTFALQARCRYLAAADDTADWVAFFREYELEPEEVLMLGQGSNLLLTEDFPGVVLYPTNTSAEVIREDEESVDVRVGSGRSMDDFICWCVQQGWGGLENLSGIPGHVGAAPVQNVGAYGVEAGERIVSLEAVEVATAKPLSIEAAACGFGYRDSRFKYDWKNRFLITSVVFRLDKNPSFRLDYGDVGKRVESLGIPSLARVREAILEIRREKLPDVKLSPNAGSFFKNPIVTLAEAEQLRRQYPQMPLYPVNDESAKLAAGWLIEQAGWKGRALGRAAVHDRQALVLVNTGGATGEEIARLANEVKKSVFMQFGVWLEPEVNII